jgi:hypothetical protein
MTQLRVEKCTRNKLFKKNINSSIIGACGRKRDEQQKKHGFSAYYD